MNTLLKNQFSRREKPTVQTFCFSLVLILCTSLLSVAPVFADQPVPESKFDYSAQTLRVGVWMDGLAEGDVLEKGEKMAVGFQTNEDAYAVVYRINTQGLVTVLWPRSRMDDGFVFGGHEYMLPVTGSRRLAASSHSGEGFVEALVSQYPFDLRELGVDFHHEFEADKLDFFISGDPFLAMNEVNFAVTGLEDSGDFVVSNYLSYYVHEVVEHPRYLCTQCHLDEDVAVHPYRDHCTIEITYDHNWGNSWYDDYGYYPVYYNPVYRYIDPWTYRPWIHFWYEPYYRCHSGYGYVWRNPVYTWCDSPFYNDYGSRRKTGRGLYNPPGVAVGQNPGRRKDRDYTRVTGQIARRGPTTDERDSMRRKQPVTRDGNDARRIGQSVRDGDRNPVVRGEKPMVRPRPSIDKPTRGSSRGGLQIRKGNDRGTRTRPDTGPNTGSRDQVGAREEVRNNPISRPIKPLRGPGSGNSTLGGNSRSGSSSGGSVQPSSRVNGERRIKPVEPRKKGTRIWNSGSGNQNNDRNSGRSVEPRRNTRSGSSSGSTVKPRNNTQRRGSRSSGSSQVKPKSNNRSSSGSSSKSSGSKVKSRSSSGSKSSSGKSSGSRSSGSSSGKSGGSGKSKSGGGSSKSGKSGGSSKRR